MPSYDAFAAHFDAWQGAFGPAYDELILDRLLAVIARHVPHARRVADLGIGTGELVLALARRSYVVYGVDRSAPMLAVAARKLTAARLAGQATLLEQDLRALALPEPVDVALCVYTVMNQLADDGDLARTCAAVRAALAPRGAFVFELNLPAAYERFWSGEDRVALPDGTTIDRVHRRAGPVIVADVTIRTPDGVVQRDVIEQRPYRDEEVERALAAAGLAVVERETFNPFAAHDAPLKALWVARTG